MLSHPLLRLAGATSLTGAEWQPKIGSPDKRLFTGRERDVETGLDYFGARYYRADLGRFAVVDPEMDFGQNMVDPMRWNRYVYCRDNPISFADPDGRGIKDFLTGVANSIGKNMTLGAFSPQVTASSPSYRFGEFMGNVLSVGLGVQEVVVGGGTAIGGGALLVSSGGTATPVAVPAVLGGTAIAGHGVAVVQAGVAGAGVTLASNTSGAGGGAKSVNQMNQEIRRGQAPGDVTRVDLGKVKGEQDNVHFQDGSSLNRDGTWKHGGRQLTNAEKQCLVANGWKLPQ